MVFWLLFSNESIQNILILSATVAPFASAGIIIIIIIIIIIFIEGAQLAKAVFSGALTLL